MFIVGEHWYMRGLPTGGGGEESAQSIDGGEAELCVVAKKEDAVEAFKGLLRWQDGGGEVAGFQATGLGLLVYAVLADNLPVVTALLRDKAVVDAQLHLPITKTGFPKFGLWGLAQPLHLAMAGASPRVVAALIKAGADPHDVVDINGQDPFMYAVASGRLDNIKAWLKQYPAWDLNQKNAFGSTALSIAAYCGQHKNLGVIKALLANGADLYVDGAGWTEAAPVSLLRQITPTPTPLSLG